VARLATAGFERALPGATSVANAEQITYSGSAPSLTTTNARTGSCLASGPTVSLDPFGVASGTGVTGRNYYFRAYGRFASAALIELMVVNGPGTFACRVRLQADGTAALFTGGLVQIGSSSAVLATNTWHRFEVRAKINSGSGADDELELRVNGVQVAVTTTATIGTAWPAGSPKITVGGMLIDDLAINDDQGTDQNSWPGDGKVLWLPPISDSAKGTGWTNDQASTTNLFASVDNDPPTGIADTTSGGGTHQLRNATSNANSAYDGLTGTYTAAGIGSSDTITLVTPVVFTAAPLVTSAKLGTVGVASNPAGTIGSLAAGGTAGAFWSGVAGGTYPTGWKRSEGPTVYNPSVTKGTGATVRINQVTASTRIAMVCDLGLIVEYVAPVTTPLSVGGTITPAGAEVRCPWPMLKATVTPAGALSPVKVPGTSGTTNPISVGGTITPAGVESSATTYRRTVTGTTTPAGVLARSLARTLTGQITPAGAVTKSWARTLTGTVTPAATLATARAFVRTFTGSVGPVGTQLRSVGKRLAGTVTPAGAETRSLARTLTGALAPVGALAKSIPRALGGTITPTGAETRQTGKHPTGTITPTASVTAAHSFRLSLTAAIAVSGALQKSLARTLTGQIATTGTLAASRTVFKALTGTVTPAATLVRSLARTLTGAITPTGTETRQTTLPRGGTVTPTGTERRSLARTLTGLVTPAAAVTVPATHPRSMGGTAAPSGALNAVRLTGVHPISVGGTITPSGTEKRTVGKALTGLATPTGAETRSTARRLTGTITPAGAETHSTARRQTGQVTPAGTLALLRVHPISVGGAITPNGVVKRALARTLAGTVTPTASMTAAHGAKLSLTATIAPTGSETRSVARRLTATIGPTGALNATRVAGTHPVAATGSLAPTGALTVTRAPRVYPITVGGTLASTGTAALIRITSSHPVAASGTIAPTGLLRIGLKPPSLPYGHGPRARLSQPLVLTATVAHVAKPTATVQVKHTVSASLPD
jgi:hypothetical protein